MQMRIIMIVYFQAHHIKASTRLRYAPPKLSPVGRQHREGTRRIGMLHNMNAVVYKKYGGPEVLHTADV